MSNFIWPESLQTLHDWLKQQGIDPSTLKTERQAAFFSQQMAGTRFSFPKDKSASMVDILHKIQKALPEQAVTTAADIQSRPRSTAGAGKGAAKQYAAPELTSQGIVVFTDGGCEPNPGDGGWGIAVYRDGAEIHTECGGQADTTNNVMELTGMLNAIRWAATQVEPVRILCDSQYTVKGCTEWRVGWKKKGWKRGPGKALANADIWQAIDAALIGAHAERIAIEWVKGHAGTVGNERADELATLGRDFARGEPLPDPIEQQLQYAI